MRRTVLLVTGLFMAAAVLLPSVAFAGNSSDTGSGVAGSVSGDGASLPFTGLNILYVVVAGLALVGVGVALRRRGSRDAG